MSGWKPYDCSSRSSAASSVSTAGWVMAVCIRSNSAFISALGSSLSTKMYSVSGLPKMGVITRSASWKTSATIGVARARSRPMFTCWLPWPGKRKAILPVGPLPLPRKMPCDSIAFHVCGLSRFITFSAFCRRDNSSSWSPKSITSRSWARIVSGWGSASGGVQPPSTRCVASRSRSCNCDRLSAPNARIPRSGRRLTTWGRGAAGAGVRVTVSTVCTAARGRFNRPGMCSSSTMWKLVPPKP